MCYFFQKDAKTKKTRTFDVHTINSIKKDDLLQLIRDEPNEFSQDTNHSDGNLKKQEDLDGRYNLLLEYVIKYLPRVPVNWECTCNCCTYANVICC